MQNVAPSKCWSPVYYMSRQHESNACSYGILGLHNYMIRDFIQFVIPCYQSSPFTVIQQTSKHLYNIYTMLDQRRADVV